MPEKRTSLRRGLAPEDCYRLRAVSDPQVSPDGRQIACVITRPDRETDQFLSDIWLISADGRSRRQLTNRHHRDSAPRWSPGGDRLAFVSPETDEKDAKPQIWAISVAGGEATRVTSLKQGASDPVWSPDGKSIAFLARDPKPTDTPGDPKAPKVEVKQGRVYATDVKVTDRILYRSGEYRTKEERRHLYVIPARGGKERRLTDGDCDDSQPAWSPDGRHLAFTSTRARDPDFDLVGDVWVVPVSGGGPKRRTALPGGASDPAWSPDGRWLAYVGSEAEEIYRLEHRLWRQPAGGGDAACLSEPFDGVPQSPRWSPDSAAVYFAADWHGFRSLWRAELSGQVRPVLPEPRTVTGFSLSPDGAVAYTASTPERPAELSLFDPERGTERRLTDLNRTALASVTLAKTESFWCQSPDGTPVQAWLVRPPGFRAGRTYPLVLTIHGGPYAAYSHSWRLDAQVLAARGYLVVYANPRGSTGYGRVFSRAVVQKFGWDDAPDVLAAVDHVVGQGGVDTSRLAVTGGSYGGFLTLWLLGTCGRFGAGVAVCPSADQRLQYHTSDIVRWREQQLGGTPWEKEELFKHVSPSSHAHKICAPLLFLHAEDDTRVPIVNSEIIYSTVKRLGVPSTFVRYPSGNHGFSGSAPRFICDTLNRLVDWFDEHLVTARRKGG